MALTPLDFPASPTDGQTYPNPPVTGQPTYQWDAATGVWLSKFALGEEYVQLDGGQPMTGLLTLSGNPTAPMHAATKSYVDSTEKGRKNYIINGAMMVSQENGTTVISANGYPADMFFVVNGSGATFTTAQVALRTPAGSPSRMRVAIGTADTSVAAGDFMMVQHVIEGLRAADLNFGTAGAKTFTLQFGVKAPAGTYSVTFLNTGAVRSYVAEYVIAAGEANTDVMKSVTVPGDVTGTWSVDNTVGMIIRWALMAGTTYQKAAGAWGAGDMMGSPNQYNFPSTVGAWFELFDVSLTEGSVAPPFQVPDYADELVACRRYYKKNPSIMGHWGETSSTEAYFSVPHTPPMRAGPTLTTLLTASRISRQVLASYNVGPCTIVDNTPSGTSFNINTATAVANVPASLVGDTVSFNARL